jgi:hypothetical protein
VSKLFIYLTNTRLVSLETRRGHIEARREFAASGTGVVEFARHLANVPKKPVHVFTDLAEEDFRLDTIPHVGKTDRDAILNRKLTQIFRNTPYRYAELQGRETEGRRDDRVMYTAVTNPEMLKPWLDAIERIKAPLAGVHSAAVFSSALLEQLDLAFPHTLLVTLSPGGGMRQTYFRDREIKFSRLTPIDLEEGQTLGTMMAEETTRTWQYLDSLRHFSEGDRLEVCVLVHRNDREAVQPALRGFAQIQYRILDIEQVAAKLGLKPAPLGSTAEEVFVHLFLNRKVANHFATSEMRRHNTVRNTRILAFQVSGAVLGASLAWGGWNLSQVVEAHNADQRSAQQLNALNREYDEITRGLPSFGVGGSAMRDAVSFYNFSIRGFPSITDFAAALSRVLQAHPEMRLAQLTWQATDDPASVASLPATQGKGAPPVKAVSKGDASGAPGASGGADRPNAAFSTGRFEVAHLEGAVRVPNNDFRGALDRVEKLAADIGALEGFKAEVVDSPLDLRSSLALQGRFTGSEPATMEARFVLRVVRERRRSA